MLSSGHIRTSSTSFCPSDISADTALSLDGTGRLDYSLKQGPKRDVLLRRALQGGTTSDPAGPSSLEVKFRTRSKSGTLLHVQESSNYTTVKVRGRADTWRRCFRQFQTTGRFISAYIPAQDFHQSSQTVFQQSCNESD